VTKVAHVIPTKTKTPKANKEQTNQHQQLTNGDWEVQFLNLFCCYSL